MNFSIFRRSIQALEEKGFYDIALLFLRNRGYQDVSIVDGPHDGGVDVTTSRPNIRIQLSVQARWEQKLNAEAAVCDAKRIPIFFYLTNRAIREADIVRFRSSKYKYGSTVDFYIFDLDTISTALADPQVAKKTAQVIGITDTPLVEATPSQIAMSALILLSQESRDVRQEIIASHVLAHLHKFGPTATDKLYENVSGKIAASGLVAREIESAFSRLMQSGRIKSLEGIASLSDPECERMRQAEELFEISIEVDSRAIAKEFSINIMAARRLVETSVDYFIRREAGDNSASKDELTAAISSCIPAKRRANVMAEIARTSVASICSRGAVLSKVCQANVSDLSRILGRQANIRVVLDTSVAMVALCSDVFTPAKSKPGFAAATVVEYARRHAMALVIPVDYINEMASHGLAALQEVDKYNALAPHLKHLMRQSKNAYIAHYAQISNTLERSGKPLSLIDFLRALGIVQGKEIYKVEDSLRSLLADLGYTVELHVDWDKSIYKALKEKRPFDPPILLQHDASVCTMLRNDVDRGFVFATWDNVLLDLVGDISRVYAANPARITDLLVMTNPSEPGTDINFDLLSALLYSDNEVLTRLAQRIDDIQGVDRVFELNSIHADLRSRSQAGDVSLAEFEEALALQL